MKNSTGKNKHSLERKWNKIEKDFRKKYHILNDKISNYEGGFNRLLSMLNKQTGIRKKELKREIRTWNTDISDMYSF